MKRLLRGRVFLNGEEISDDVHEITIRHAADELVMATVEFFVNDVTKDKEGALVYWLGTTEMVIEGGAAGCPLKSCKITEPHLHTREESERL